MLGGARVLSTLVTQMEPSSSSPARRASTGGRSSSSAGSAPATSRSSTTPTSTASRPRSWSSRACASSSTWPPSQTGRFPNPGPLLLVRGGVRLIDVAGAELFDERLRRRAAHRARRQPLPQRHLPRDRPRARARTSSQRALAEQRGRVTEALEAFADNTMRYLREEGRLLAEGIDFPPLETRFRDRHALVVARGPGHKRDLRIVRPYVRDFKPVLVGRRRRRRRAARGGWKPDVIVGDMDSVSDDDAALRRRDRRPRLPRRDTRRGAARLDTLGVPYQTVAAPGISEDIALLLAYEKGAELIVAVGTHFNLIEFLEREPRRACRRRS